MLCDLDIAGEYPKLFVPPVLLCRNDFLNMFFKLIANRKSGSRLEGSKFHIQPVHKKLFLHIVMKK